MAGERNREERAALPVGAHGAAGLEAVEVGHADVHHHRVGMPCLRITTSACRARSTSACTTTRPPPCNSLSAWRAAAVGGTHSLESAATGVVRVSGLPYDIRIHDTTTADVLTVRGNEGDDVIKSVNPTGNGALNVESVVSITLAGGAGNDFLSADAILIGGAGDDFLEGGAGDDMLFGNEGEDSMIGGGGQDTYNGGPGFDTILIRGTAGVSPKTAARWRADAIIVR